MKCMVPNCIEKAFITKPVYMMALSESGNVVDAFNIVKDKNAPRKNISVCSYHMIFIERGLVAITPGNQILLPHDASFTRMETATDRSVKIALKEYKKVKAPIVEILQLNTILEARKKFKKIEGREKL